MPAAAVALLESASIGITAAFCTSSAPMVLLDWKNQWLTLCICCLRNGATKMTKNRIVTWDTDHDVIDLVDDLNDAMAARLDDVMSPSPLDPTPRQRDLPQNQVCVSKPARCSNHDRSIGEEQQYPRNDNIHICPPVDPQATAVMRALASHLG